MLPMPSTSICRPASRHQPTKQSRPCLSTSVSVRRRTPPLGVAPMRARSMSDCHNLPEFTASMAGSIHLRARSLHDRSPAPHLVLDHPRHVLRGAADDFVAEVGHALHELGCLGGFL